METLQQDVNKSNNLSAKLNLKKDTLTANGTGLVIAVLDSGIDTRHPSLKNAVISETVFLTSAFSSTVINDHGTKVAGVLCGANSIVTGLATGAKIRSYRVIQDNEFVDNAAVLKALQQIAVNEPFPDIINMSLDILYGYTTLISPYINKLAAAGTIVVVAGGTTSLENNISELEQVYPIGVFEGGSNGGLTLPAVYCASFLNASIETTGIVTQNNGEALFADASAYTAVVSGIVAKFIDQENIARADRLNAVKVFLQENSFSIQQDTSPASLKPYL